MKRLSLGLCALLLVACPKEPVAVAPTPPAAPAPPPLPEHRLQAPSPLAPRPFQVPALAEARLSNGITVVVAENHELPFVWVDVAFEVGSSADPAGKEGLTDATFDMLNEGAGKRDSVALSAEMRRLGMSLGTGSALDGSSVSVQALKRNLEPSLDLLASVLREPTFPQGEWEIIHKRRLQDLEAARQNPASMANRALNRVAFGDAYLGRLPSEASYGSMKASDMKAWYGRLVDPAHLTVLVGGDTSLAEIQPLLEQRLGKWSNKKPLVPPASPRIPTGMDPEPIYFLHKDKATQSQVTVARFAGKRTDPDWTALTLADRAFGGQFTSRINLFLREEKGWTYGARSGLQTSHMQSLWTAGASVVASSTADSVAYLLSAVAESTGNKPFTAAELADAQSSQLGTWPLNFESTGYLLGATLGVRRYGLPTDWIQSMPSRVRAVDVGAANAAWSRHMSQGRLMVVVVGDEAVVRPELEKLGRPIVKLDPDGKVVK